MVAMPFSTAIDPAASMAIPTFAEVWRVPATCTVAPVMTAPVRLFVSTVRTPFTAARPTVGRPVSASVEAASTRTDELKATSSVVVKLLPLVTSMVAY